MDFKETVINFFSISRCSAGQLFGLRGPDLARRPIIEDPWPMILNKAKEDIRLNVHAGRDPRK